MIHRSVLSSLTPKVIQKELFTGNHSSSVSTDTVENC